MKGRRLPVIWLIAILIWLALLICPLRSTFLRLAIISLCGILWCGLLLLGWRWTLLRWIMPSVTAVALLFLVWPARSAIDEGQLRATYVARLCHYDGAKYVYGGENSLGIDCSGLVRAAMFTALRIYAIRNLDPEAMRASLRLWWRDCNAIDLGRGRTGDTFPVDGEGFVKLSDHPNIVPGDLAVTETGSHVIAYLGNETWIEAEPTVGCTHVFKLSGPFASLADERVRFVRWKWLD